MTTSIINNGSAQTATEVVRGLTGLSADLMAGLNSADPQVRGEALVNALAIGWVATAVGTKLGLTVLENVGTGPVPGSLGAQRGGVKIPSAGGVAREGGTAGTGANGSSAGSSASTAADAGAAVKPVATTAVEGAVPNAGNAVIDPNKLTSYALNPDHPVGGNKAVVFDSALGYNQSNADQLIAKIQQGVLDNPAVLGKADQYGQRFTVDMLIAGPNGNTVVVRTGWIVAPGSAVPKLTTAYVK